MDIHEQNSSRANCVLMDGAGAQHKRKCPFIASTRRLPASVSDVYVHVIGHIYGAAAATTEP